MKLGQVLFSPQPRPPAFSHHLRRFHVQADQTQLINHRVLFLVQAFRTKDGHVVIAAGNDKQFVHVCQVTWNSLMIEKLKSRLVSS